MDPLAGEFPTLTPYHFVANNPILIMDPDGRDTLVMHRSPKLTKEERTAIFGSLDQIDFGGDLEIYIVSFSIIENGTESTVGPRMYMFANPTYSQTGDNGLPKESYTLKFDKMKYGEHRDNDIRVTEFGVFIHPGNNTLSWKGCYGLSENPDLSVSNNGYLTVSNTAIAQQTVRDLYNAANGGANGNSLTGEKFLLRTNSLPQQTPIIIPPLNLKDVCPE